MVNTTGSIGYFQRVLAKKLIPSIPLLSAHPSTCYAKGKSDPEYVLQLFEVRDKGPNTQQAISVMNLSSPKIVLMGDSGGDGPHFQWGAANNAFLIGSLTKPSLKRYCRMNGIRMDLMFGAACDAAGDKNQKAETGIDFRELMPVIADVTGISANTSRPLA